MSAKASARAHRTLVPVAAIAAVIVAVSTVPAAELAGRVVDARTGEPIPDANIRITQTGHAAATEVNGEFDFANLPDGSIELVITHIAYRPWRRTAPAESMPPEMRLQPIIHEEQGIVVTTNRALRGESPVAFENITTEEIRRSYYAQDVPMLLTQAPGVYASSDNGNGIGYSYLSIRGFSQRRVSVLINGVPLNDPESHEVYWIDLPDLPENTQDIQIQRGVGTTLYGSNSIGGTVNLLTSQLSPIRTIMVNSGLGSYDTRKFSVALNSGLIDGRHAMYGRFSRIVSDGYREGAWTDLWSYFLSAARYDEKWTNRVNIFGGPEKTHLSYKGIPRRFIDGDTSFVWNVDGIELSPVGDVEEDRRFNPLQWEEETDNFNQPQYQLLTEYRPNDNWTFENTLYYIKGSGFYDQYRTNKSFDEYHLTPLDVDGEEINEAEVLVRRRQVDNDFYGIVPRASCRHRKGVLSFGAEFRHLKADHWAEIRSVRPAPLDFIPGQRYYSYDGRKTVLHSGSAILQLRRP
jgi:iron complex outermembrane receptor protein